MKLTIKHIVRSSGVSIPVLFTAEVRMVNTSIGFFEYGGLTVWDEGQKYIDVEDIEYDMNMYTHEEMEIIDKEIEKGTIDKEFVNEYKSILENNF
jgi:hypothetical protein